MAIYQHQHKIRQTVENEKHARLRGEHRYAASEGHFPRDAARCAAEALTKKRKAEKEADAEQEEEEESERRAKKKKQKTDGDGDGDDGEEKP